MSRTDRLFDLMTRLKDGRLHRAEDLAREMGVSVRTIYRDMDTLAASGVPVEGERGQGYTARAAITLPPLNLTEPELEALQLGLAALAESGLEDQAAAAQSLSQKIEAVLPEETGQAARRFGFATRGFAEAARGFRFMPAVRAAIRARQKLRVRLAGAEKPHDLRPLHLDYWGRVWTCVAWDETSERFETIRIDHIETLAPLPGLFVDEVGKRYADYLATRD
ncbi:helix-turn-helix transcriptional regulator [Litorisediminicola beolgyonensis]|uniref:Helix-turn-helix transcriptional regulator n=1 Tax=Litorisediminicola beolgyonensis TaxID=1173614 RepID=A0ABW3ZEM0_9RHOB